MIVHGAGGSGLPSGEIYVIDQEKAFLESEGIAVELLLDQSFFGKNPLSLFWSFDKRRRLRDTIEAFRPDLIHFHSVIPYLGLSVLMLAKKMGVPTVQTLHNGRWLCVEGGFYRGGRYCSECVGKLGWQGVLHGCGRGHLHAALLFLVNWIARFNGNLFSWIDHWIAVSDYVREQHIQSDFPAEQITVNNNSIDLELLEGKEELSLAWNERSGVAYAGRISVAKGTQVLRHLMTSIDQPIHVIGDGPDLEALRLFCRENGFDHVNFWGKQSRSKTLEILGSVTCTVVPSQCGETFSLVAAESMALGTPVVASEVGGVADLVREAGGVVVDPENREGFVRAIRSYLGSTGKAEEAGENGREYVQEHLAMRQRGEALLQIYKRVLGK